MSRDFFRSTSENSVRVSLFVFFILLAFSTAFFVFADDNSTGKNIFQDSDQDGLSNDEEKLYGTDPFNKDTDGDSYSDGVEVESGYDPLKKAPGDKITGKISDKSSDSNLSTINLAQSSLTEQVSTEIATAIKVSSDTNEPITLEQMNESVQKILDSSSQEVVLPEVDIKDIKIKKAPSKNLSSKKREEQERQDAIEYLTVMSYLLANNSPKTFHTENDLGNMLTSLSSESLSALTSGNSSYINQLSQRGEKILDESKDIEVPEGMLDIHIKALRMAKYAVKLKTEATPATDDPLGQISTLSKIQGFLGVATSFSEDVSRKLASYGIQEIPINL